MGKRTLPKRKVPFLVYPTSYEEKVGLDKVWELIKNRAESPMGRENINRLKPSSSFSFITRRLKAVGEMMELLRSGIEFPSLRFIDLSIEIKTLETSGSYLVADKLYPFQLFLQAVEAIRRFFTAPKGVAKEENEERFPLLRSFLLPNIEQITPILTRLNAIVDRTGGICDNASPTLYTIRREIATVERLAGKIARRVLSEAIANGWSEDDALPTIRDGHMLIPINPTYKRMVQGVVFDESATGKTLFVEPLEVIENSNRLRELHTEERQEIIKILILFSDLLRPHTQLLVALYTMVGILDGIRAIALFAIEEDAVIPRLEKRAVITWEQARHPLLRRSLAEQGRAIVPLSISLSAPDARILVISGPNAGGKSVCLKTVATLQYMLQAGIPIPVSPDSIAGVFDTLAINIGDDQSIEDDLSTYSSHLRAMSRFCQLAGKRSLLMVDEFGAGTEPELGGAIAEALLNAFNAKGSFGIVTTHYRNLKQFAAHTEGVVNGAMLYDRGAMAPTFQLAIGQPGSSFAMQIARRSGIPQEVLDNAEQLAGKELVGTDSYVQDILRDKAYWQRKRDEVRKQNNRLAEELRRYEEKLTNLSQERKTILAEAKKEAATIIAHSNALVERTIREIKESEAEREQTARLRARLEEKRQLLEQNNEQEELSFIKTELHRTQKEGRRRGARRNEQTTDTSPNTPLAVGDSVEIVPTKMVATIVELRGEDALLALGNNLSTIKPLSMLRPTASKGVQKATEERLRSNITEHIHEKKVQFREELDVRGLRSEEALRQVDYFIDEALLVGSEKIKILHGTGSGALRQSIRQWLASSPYVKHFEDEDVRFGGAGITIVYLS